MSGFVCHLARDDEGGLASARLVGPGMDEAWRAREGEDEPGSSARLVREAAAWVAERLGSATRTLELVTVDPAGGICSWVSAPSPEPSVVTAAIRQQAGSTNPLAEAALSPARSTQALAGAGEGQATTRFPVLSVPDAPVRVFLDELDRLGIEVRAVESLWHALAAAWDPSAQDMAGAGWSEREPARVVAGDGPATAVVMLDPEGRLVWSWSRQGSLVAAGSMRLSVARPGEVRTAARSTASSGAQGMGEAGPDEPTTIIDLARRVEDGAEEHEAAQVDCGGPEVGRLALDWLSFSAQTGVSPERIVAFGAAGVNGDGASIAQRLGRAWPGVTVDAATDDDPVGSTLRRLSSVSASAAAVEADARASLSALTRRPGRASRWMYRWSAAAIVTLAAALCVLGWQLRAAADTTREQAADLRAEQKAIITGLTEEFDSLNKEKLRNSASPGAELGQALAALRMEIEKEPGPKPVVEELLAILEAIEPDKDKVKVKEIQISLAVVVRMTVPDTDTGPQILARLKDLSRSLEWQGEFGLRSRTSNQEGREYVLTGTWRKSAPARTTP